MKRFLSRSCVGMFATDQGVKECLALLFPNAAA
jgi:hypothetical protein